MVFSLHSCYFSDINIAFFICFSSVKCQVLTEIKACRLDLYSPDDASNDLNILSAFIFYFLNRYQVSSAIFLPSPTSIKHPNYPIVSGASATQVHRINFITFTLLNLITNPFDGVGIELADSLC